ncbi:MAG: metallophosphoesterase [Pseudanabaenaceae cyanobacterium]
MIHQFLAGKLQLEYVTVPIDALPQRLAGLRIVHLSDFHFDGLRLGVKLLTETIAQANALAPDVVVLTGDFVTYEPEPILELAPYLAQLQAKVGIFAVLGNHDLELSHSRELITQTLTRWGIQVLENAVVYPWGEGLAIVGLGDYWSDLFLPQRVLPAIPPQVPRLVLSHNPDTAAILRKWRVDLQLSGHTHGGQIVLPHIGPVMAYARPLRLSMPRSIRKLLWRSTHEVVKHWEWAQGLHRVGKNWLYVNRGLGTYLPGRLNCPPELTCITLVPAATTAPPPLAMAEST